MSDELSKLYDPKQVEDKWYADWVKNKYFHADPNSKRKSYTIVIPPPNVTGVLTMGHVLNNSLQDILCRLKRMQGFEVLWLPGTDHAGIATQTVVERTLKKEGVIKHRDDLGREKFIEKVWEWKRRHGNIIIQQLKKLGCSCDWEREVFTMDGLDPQNPDPRVNYPSCVQKVFIDLYKKGAIYRGKKMVNWCPVSRTALSDEEVVMKEVDSHLWYIKYPILSEKACHSRESGNPEKINALDPHFRGDDKFHKTVSSEYIIVATTRPETMLGDEAVAVNPKDKRYKHLIGRNVWLPLQNRPIPIIADAVVEMSFGTGAVKVTPAHDPADYDMGIRHKLPITMVIGTDGIMTAAAGEKFEGLDRFECRKAVVFELEEAGLLQKTEAYKHSVGFSQRADVPVEPMLSEQWFLKYPSLERSMKAVKDGKIKFWPERWVKVYLHWLEGIRDWCISRQLWWGHRIPAWYCKGSCDGSIVRSFDSSSTRNHRTIEPSNYRTIEPSNYRTKCPPIVSIEKPSKCPLCGCTDFEQDPDVLDTWFSSWLWPFATMGWPEKTPELKKFYPTTDLVTGPDIIFFWVARMIMAGYEFMGERPFDNVYFTGIIRDEQGRKMSKSLGNSPDPLEIIERYGADGLRFGLMLIAPKGQDILFSDDRVEVGRNFMNKLWNASRFVMMNLCDSSIVRSFDGKNSHHRTIEPSNHRTIEPSHHRTIELSNHRTIEPSHHRTTLADKWILNRLQHVTRDVNKAFEHYQFDAAARALYQFIWGEYCDWYLELSKSQLAHDDTRATTQAVLIHVLNNIVCLLHPFAPFITEEIWQKLGTPCHSRESGNPELDPCLRRDDNALLKENICPTSTIMFAQYPVPPKKIEYAKDAREMQTVMDVINAIRNIRGEHNVAPSKKISVILVTHDKPTMKTLEANKKYITDLARVGDMSVLFGAKPPKDAAAAVAGSVEVFIPFAGFIDVAEEKERLLKEVAKIEANVGRLTVKLSNEKFVKNAPKEIVDKEKTRLEEAESELKKLTEALGKL